MIGGGFGGSAGSAAADAVHRGIGLLPAGQRVAVITVREALTRWTEDFAGYGVPCEIGHYSVQGERREYVDGAIQKRYLRTAIPLNPDWDLNTGYENALRRMGESSLPTHNLLRWVMLNKDKVVSPSSQEAKSPRTDFICGRYTLATLLCTPFEEGEAWRIAACRHKDIVYIRGIPMNEGVEQSLSESRDRYRDRLRYWSQKFQLIMTTDEAGAAAPKENEVVTEGDAYNVVLRGQLGSHTIVLGAQLKAVNPSVPCEPGSTAGYVEFKTCRDNFKRSQRYKFYRHTLLRWWAQCRLAGVPKAFCGFRKESGILFSIQEFDVMKMPERATGKWSEDICMKFCDQLLSFIKRHVEEKDGRNAYLFEYVPTSGEVVCKRLTDPGNFYGLPDWFLEAFEGY
ncbi:decapping and exoribonuclease protein-like [Dermacentor andersoni]|uniref:decapping and exoribonuclease protein-like n=1 Tax=Dermacentor andersoni TaxID=34620 RepID=UPI002415F63E|nr:decapping and exoribonuclease protein-like [Dermacentor andersoni]